MCAGRHAVPPAGRTAAHCPSCWRDPLPAVSGGVPRPCEASGRGAGARVCGQPDRPLGGTPALRAFCPIAAAPGLEFDGRLSCPPDAGVSSPRPAGRGSRRLLRGVCHGKRFPRKRRSVPGRSSAARVRRGFRSARVRTVDPGGAAKPSRAGPGAPGRVARPRRAPSACLAATEAPAMGRDSPASEQAAETIPRLAARAPPPALATARVGPGATASATVSACPRAQAGNCC